MDGMGMETSPKMSEKNPGGNSTPNFHVNFNDFNGVPFRFFRVRTP